MLFVFVSLSEKRMSRLAPFIFQAKKRENYGEIFKYKSPKSERALVSTLCVLHSRITAFSEIFLGTDEYPCVIVTWISQEMQRIIG